MLLHNEYCFFFEFLWFIPTISYVLVNEKLKVIELTKRMQNMRIEPKRNSRTLNENEFRSSLFLICAFIQIVNFVNYI